MRTLRTATTLVALLMHASAPGTVAAQDDPASRFVQDRQADRPHAETPADPSIDPPPPSVVAAATDAGVDPVDLYGAVTTVGVEPRVYLRSEGLLDNPPAPPPPKPAPVASSAVGGVWARLAQCESGGNWRTNTGNSYYGGLQEDMTFWRNYGGLAYAARPDLASPDAQVVVAQRGLAAQGYGAWPACSRKLGLR